MSAELEQIVALSRALGDPALELAILGEGNTSLRTGEGDDAGQGQRRVAGSVTAADFVEVETGAADGAAGRPRGRRRRRGAGVRAGRGAHRAAPVRGGDAPRRLPRARRRAAPSATPIPCPSLALLCSRARRGAGDPDALPGPDRRPRAPAALRAVRRSGPRAGTPRPRRSRDARGPPRRAAEGDLPRQPRPVRAGRDAGARAADHRDGGQGEPGAGRGARGGRRQRAGDAEADRIDARPDEHYRRAALARARTRGRRAMPEGWTGRSRSSPARAPGSGAPWRRSCCGAGPPW